MGRGDRMEKRINEYIPTTLASPIKLTTFIFFLVIKRI
jgi:hypothetical protein